MIVTFHIEYRTSWGEEVRILGSVPELGKNNPEQAVALTTVDGIHWSNEISIQLPAEGVVEYSYHIYRDGKAIRTEWNSFPRLIYLPADVKKACASMTAGRIFRSSNTSTVRHLPKHCWRTANEAQSPKATKRIDDQGLCSTHQQQVLPGHLW